MSKPFKVKNPYPTNRKGKINPNSEGNTDLKDGRSKSSTFQRYKKTGTRSTMDSYPSMEKIRK